VPGRHPRRRRRPPSRALRQSPRPGRRARLRLPAAAADREEGAQFWLQFAAGGGQATGALCLYLLHLARGEWRDAKYWARQVPVLEHEPCQYAPVPHEVVDTAPGPGGLTVYIDLPEDAATVPKAAVKDAIEDLDVNQLDGFGAIPQPSPELAHQLEDLVTTGH
jgi:hypothetical protein